MVEPVERLARGDDVRERVGQRDDLGGRGSRSRPGGAGEEVEHLRQRLDRRHAVAEGDERTAQLPRAGAEIDDPGSSPASQRTASSGYPGRPRSPSATPANTEDGPASVVAVGAHAEISAAPSRSSTRRGTTSRTLSCAQNAMSSSSSGAFSSRLRPLFDARSASSGPAHVAARRAAASAASVAEELDDAAGDVGVVERERALDPAQTTIASSPTRCLLDDGPEVQERRHERPRTAPRRRRRPASRSSSTGRASTRRARGTRAGSSRGRSRGCARRCARLRGRRRRAVPGATERPRRRPCRRPARTPRRAPGTSSRWRG